MNFSRLCVYANNDEIGSFHKLNFFLHFSSERRRKKTCPHEKKAPVILFDIRLVVWVHTTAVTAFNVCCVSIDRSLAIQFLFLYHDILTKRRCFAVIIFECFISLRLPFFDIFLSTRKGSKRAFHVLCV